MKKREKKTVDFSRKIAEQISTRCIFVGFYPAVFLNKLRCFKVCLVNNVRICLRKC